MTRNLVCISLLTLLGACGSAGTEPEYAVFPTTEQGLTLSAVGWTDDKTEWAAVSILNESWFPFDIRDVRVSGVGAPFLELESIGVSGGATVAVRESLPLRVRIRPAGPATVAQWSSGVYEATLEFTIYGTGKIDEETQAFDTSAIVPIPKSIPLSFRLACDLDGDGYDASSCSGGADCDDTLVEVRPDQRESCDEIDNDCDGSTDENCTAL
jgi:hypothetical protein